MKEYLMIIGVVVGILGLLVSITTYVVMASAKKKSEQELKDIFARQQFEWRVRERELINDFRSKLDYLSIKTEKRSLAVPGEFHALTRIQMHVEKLDPIQPGPFMNTFSPYATFMTREFELRQEFMVGYISDPQLSLEHIKRNVAKYLVDWVLKNDFFTVRFNNRRNAFEVGVCYYTEREKLVV